MAALATRLPRRLQIPPQWWREKWAPHFLVLDRFVLDKCDMQPLADDVDWRNQFELD